MRFSTIFVAALSSAGFAMATTSKNGIIKNGAFDSDAFNWDVSTNRDGTIGWGPDISQPHGSPPIALGWHWWAKRVRDGTIAPNYGIITQTIPNLIPNGYYTLSFAAYNDNTNTDSDYFLRVKIDENQISEGSSLGLTNLVTTFEITFQAPASAAQGVKLSFESQNNAGSVFLDEIGITAKLTASQSVVQARRRRLAEKRDTLCSRPSEKACPIGGWPYRVDLAENAAVLKKVGWECIDTAQELESCGGCASVPGDGVNCLAIPGVDAYGVSCTTGQCVIDACEEGYSVSADQSTCIRN
ncbi:hypothetical protein FFLO_04876 [Filobasidium floriforme]|uniref:Protein CPL1-like domain-containing protein n=1 Tax=Filobasidium floriforme TaxID=5210 RepID=A0A8K0JJ90_9TREE|nr:hypothetical protein FFLO_04876 [Filobasidium floriforme]